jgi:hypothetical protein
LPDISEDDNDMVSDDQTAIKEATDVEFEVVNDNGE